MKKIVARIFCFIVSSLFVLLMTVTACSEGGDDNEPTLNAPALVSTDPEDGATDIVAGDITIVLTYDQNVTSPSSGHSLVTLGDATVSGVSASLTKVKIKATGLEEGMDYELIVPAGVVLGPTKIEAPEITIHFSTVAVINVNITTSLAMKNPLRQAQNVYDFLIENYGKNILSSTMANVAWNINEAEWVKLQTGKYPVIATFDYIQLPYSPANWIDYSDITLLEDWWNNNGLISAGWHWLVPTDEGTTEYTYKPSETTFSAVNATVEGTWENEEVNADLGKIAGLLKLLQDQNIPVIWRPLHEAAGNIYEYSGGEAWFWWGADGADAYKKLWIYMFDYFESKGLNNLIWVWTTQTNDQNFYPGDDYVDIIGRDIYDNSDESDIADEFKIIQKTYFTKIVTLSECGNISTITKQWSAGAKWSYFMPWYDYDRTNDTSSSVFENTEHDYADANWWIDAFSMSEVITRDGMPDLR